MTTLTLAIDGTRYSLARDPSPGRAWRMRKLGEDAGDGHAVERIKGRITCSCPDYQYRHLGTDGTCKHGRAALAMGLLRPPRIIPGE